MGREAGGRARVERPDLRQDQQPRGGTVMLSERPVRATCKHCDGTGVSEKKLRSGQCPAPWWDMTREPFVEWACGRPPVRGSRYCADHKRQIELLTQGVH